MRVLYTNPLTNALQVYLFFGNKLVLHSWCVLKEDSHISLCTIRYNSKYPIELFAYCNWDGLLHVVFSFCMYLFTCCLRFMINYLVNELIQT